MASQKIRETLRRAADRGRRLVARKRVRQRVSEDGGIKAENVIWIFGTGRSGSTWLGSMLGDIDECALWNEPLVGNLFGNFYYFRAGDRIGRAGKHFIMGDLYRETWLGPMRDLVLGGASVRFPQMIDHGYLVIKEPNGSVGAPLLMEALPESRMILLIRDPRDVVASSLDARSEGGWLYERRHKEDRERQSSQGKNPNAYARTRANTYVQQIGYAKQAYDAHRGRKVLVRYEELRSDALGTMRRICSALALPFGDEELARVVERHAWENIPEEEKGPGKMRRKAQPGGWQEDLTPKQIDIVEKITAPLLDEFYPVRSSTQEARRFHDARD